jgi:DNA polymerase III subunit beta
MKFSSLQENLSSGLQIVLRAVPTKPQLPVLANVYISTEDGRIKLAATDLATTIITFVGASIETTGATTVPAKLLKDFVGNLIPGALNIHLEEEIMHVLSETTKSKFSSIASDDYPELPEFALETPLIEIDPKVLTDTIKSVAFSSGTDTSRPVFAGTLLHQQGTKLTIAATDGYRLSEKVLEIAAGNQEQETKAIIPTKALLEIARIFAKTEEPIKIALSEDENQVIFLAEDTYVSTRIIDGEYPPYQQIVPTETTLSAKFSAEEFLNAVRLTSIFASIDDSGGAIKIIIDPDNQHIKVKSLGEETGEHESTLPAEISGDLTEIAFNVKYVLDFLSNIKGPEVIMETNGTTSPCIFKSTAHENYVHIIMPVQL